MALSKTEVLERIERCKKNNLCYITLRRLEDIEIGILEIEYEPGIFVRIISNAEFMKY